MIACLLTVTVLHYYSCEIVFAYISQISFLDSSATQAGFQFEVNPSPKESSWEF